MKISRFYQACDLHVGDELALSTINHRHAIQVLRLKLGEALIIFNGSGGEYLARILRVEKRSSHIVIESFDSVNRESRLHTTFFLAMIKPEKMDFAIQKMVELGVTEIQPMYTKRSVIKIKSNRLDKKMLHWQGVTIAACEQSGRTSIPVIHEPKTMTDCLNLQIIEHFFVMLPGNHTIITQLEKSNIPEKNISFLIGPEGGFTPEEEQLMQGKGVIPISFGKRILRAETAAISGLAVCQVFWGDLK